ncbi:hypothetical protein CIHG_00711 [Coccidioides immitis H538.4]|uniref:Uncharacterized protein n=1 Tax=Coccidioides immitis H538.4 TaxID=396776 RepID=A0A0J8RG09_COCIT|nr:hypothetical protein CIHG_00711 [Coccidioides immitis H538.4]
MRRDVKSPTSEARLGGAGTKRSLLSDSQFLKSCRRLDPGPKRQASPTELIPGSKPFALPPWDSSDKKLRRLIIIIISIAATGAKRTTPEAVVNLKPKNGQDLFACATSKLLSGASRRAPFACPHSPFASRIALYFHGSPAALAG